MNFKIGFYLLITLATLAMGYIIYLHIELYGIALVKNSFPDPQTKENGNIN